MTKLYNTETVFKLCLTCSQKTFRAYIFDFEKKFAFSKTSKLGYNLPANNVSMSGFHLVHFCKNAIFLLLGFSLASWVLSSRYQTTMTVILHYYSSTKHTQISTSKKTFYSWTFTFIKENNSLLIMRINKCQCS